MNKSAKIKILIGAIIFLLIGFSAKITFTNYAPAQQIQDENIVVTTNIPETLLFPDNSAMLSVLEIPDKKQPKAPEDLAVQASIVVNLTSGEEIFTLQEHNRWPMASIVKLMGSIIALENMDEEQKIIISPVAIEVMGHAERFTVGDSYSVIDLISAMMIISSNVAAVALAENMPAGQFVYLMNRKASEIGMHNTRFYEPTGLSSLNQSTANDLAIFVRYTWSTFPKLFTLSARESVVIKELNLNQNVRLDNINPLAVRNNFLGGKTGTTLSANQNLVAVFSIARKNIAIIILGADDRIKETEKIIYHINNASNTNY